MKNVKKLSAIILVLAFVMMLGSCGNNNTASTVETQSAEASSAVEEPVPSEASDFTLVSISEAETEVSAEEEMALPAPSISYPLPEGDTFTMTTIFTSKTQEVLGNDAYDATTAYETFAAQTGCSIEFVMLAEETSSEKINIAIASGDLTDMYTRLGNYQTNLMGAIEEGILFDMSPLIEENAPDYLAMLEADPDIKAAAYNNDGSISQFLGKEAGVVNMGMIIRQDWLDKLELSAPTNREDLETVLSLFKSEFGAKNPIIVYNTLDSSLISSFNTYVGLFTANSYFQLTEPNGPEVVFTYASDNFIDYLLYLNHLYEEGLVTSDFMNMERGVASAACYAGEAGVWSNGYNEMLEEARSNAADPEYRVSAMALTDYECHVSTATTVSDNALYITAACENPALAMQMINYCYTEEGKRTVLYGAENVSYIVNDDGDVELTEIITNNENGWNSDSALFWYSAKNWLPQVMDISYYKTLTAATGGGMDVIEYWTEVYGDNTMRLPSGLALSVEDSAELNLYANDVLTALGEGAMKVVMGELDEAGYRSLIESVNDMGLTRMTELYQNTYDEFKARNI